MSWKTHLAWGIAVVVAGVLGRLSVDRREPGPPATTSVKVVEKIVVPPAPSKIASPAEVPAAEPAVEALPPRVEFPGGSATIDEIRAWLGGADFADQWKGAKAIESIKDRKLRRELLLLQLQCAHPQMRWSALYQLKRQDADATMEILRTVVRKDPSAEVRYHAAGLLGEPGGEGNLELLLGVYREDELRVQVAAAAALNFNGHPGPMMELLPKLGSSLDAADAALRKEAAERIEHFMSPATLPYLTLALRDSSGDVRLVAARGLWTLAGLGQAGVVPLLETLQNDPVAEVKEAVRAYLDELRKEKK